MSIQTLCRGGFLLLCAALMSGCSSSSTPSPWSSPNSGSVTSGSPSSRVSLECRVTSCLYNGKYEPGERDYAEAEAKRLNRAEMERLRRAAGN
ncbi:hypothetical protein [Achromobacter sp. 79A6]|jgi:hypothetical protein|uniref:hypothetical protein n=1 Tax=unclassified Achromobacter TaxID=2626865 RepID=UPI0021F19D3B